MRKKLRLLVGYIENQQWYKAAGAAKMLRHDFDKHSDARSYLNQIAGHCCNAQRAGNEQVAQQSALNKLQRVRKNLA